jgi:pimeloyl-ACP methyl ester carboxylesterase
MRVTTNGVELEVNIAGEGTPVVLLHGWPETSALWRHQIPALVNAGFRAVAPDLRGFGDSSRPDGVDSYQGAQVVMDIVGMLDELAIERAHVVGHDFGSAMAWSLASFFPQRVDRLVVMSVGHPLAFRRAGLEQRQKMWYALLFQFDGIAEEWLRRDDWRNLRTFLADHPDLDRCIEGLARPGALTSTLNWYRANLGPRNLIDDPMEFPLVEASTLAVWSTRDHALTEEPMLLSQQFMSGPWRYERLEDIGHYIPLEAPDAITDLLLGHLT